MLIANTRSPFWLAAIDTFDEFGFERSKPLLLVMLAVNAPATFTCSFLFKGTLVWSSALTPCRVVLNNVLF